MAGSEESTGWRGFLFWGFETVAFCVALVGIERLNASQYVAGWYSLGGGLALGGLGSCYAGCLPRDTRWKNRNQTYIRQASCELQMNSGALWGWCRDGPAAIIVFRSFALRS
jgi:hypothetical protein